MALVELLVIVAIACIPSGLPLTVVSGSRESRIGGKSELSVTDATSVLDVGCGEVVPAHDVVRAVRHDTDTENMHNSVFYRTGCSTTVKSIALLRIGQYVCKVEMEC